MNTDRVRIFGNDYKYCLCGTNDGLELFRLSAMLIEMAKIFYLGGSHTRGMLRAVLPLHQLEPLLSPESVTHVGGDFPEASDAPITLVEIPHEEGTATWPAGFCRVEMLPTDFDERLRFLPEPPNPHADMNATSKIPSSSALIH